MIKWIILNADGIALLLIAFLLFIAFWRWMQIASKEMVRENIENSK